MTDQLEYTPHTEELFIRFFMSFPDVFVRCLSIVFPRNYSDPKNRKAITFILEHANKYRTVPTFEQLEVFAGKKYERISQESTNDNHLHWLMTEYEQFARHKELEYEILSSPDLLEQGKYGEVEQRIKRAVQVSLVKDLGTDYFRDPRARLEEMLKKETFISSGWRDLDKKLYGGYTEGSLNIFVGQSGAGKSLFLMNTALNFVEQGLDCLYVTYELSEKLCAMRVDAMTTGFGTKDIFKNLSDVELRVVTYAKKHRGSLQIKQMLNGSTTNDIRAYIKEYEIQTGRKIKGLIVDYLDLMMPYTVKVSPENAFVKDKYIAEELRNLGAELNCVVVTASQFNRGSHETTDFGHAHIAGGISKINTADNVFGIFITNTMRESGRYQLQMLKTRSSSGVGSRVDLKFDVTSLRIRDLDEHELDSTATTTNSVIDKLKKSGAIRPPEETENKGQVNVLESGLKLREMLKRRSD